MTRPSASELLRTPGALLTTSDLAALGFTRQATDRLLQILPTVHVDGFRRPFVYADDVTRLLADSTYRGDRVR
jgi:hypothetical protein